MKIKKSSTYCQQILGEMQERIFVILQIRQRWNDRKRNLRVGDNVLPKKETPWMHVGKTNGDNLIQELVQPISKLVLPLGNGDV